MALVPYNKEVNKGTTHMTNVTVYKAPAGKSIRAQLTKVSKARGIIVYTFWWNNTVTKMDGFSGQHQKLVFPNVEAARQSFRELEAQGYTRV